MNSYPAKIGYLLIFVAMAIPARAQKLFSTYLGAGLGRHFERPFPYTDQVNNGRIAISLTQYAKVSDRFSIGLSAMASGRLSAILGGASAPSDYYDPTTNTQIINYNNQNATTFLLKSRYDWRKKDNLILYADMGLGITRYQYVMVAQSAFSFAPEVGVNIEEWQFAATFIWGGKTPAFTAPSALPNATVLTSIKSNRLYFTVSNRLFKF